MWILDFMYYNRLLVGAVDALLEIEGQSKQSCRVDMLILSTKIEAAVAGQRKWAAGRLQRERARWWFYGLVFSR